MKTISIITPVFEGGDLLRQTINSVKDQCLPDNIYIQHIIVSDDLLDYSSYQEYTSRYECISLSTLKRGAGPSFARNVGMSVCNGDYISFLDADDLWLPQRLSTLLPFVERYGAATDTISFIDMDNNRIYGNDTVIKTSGFLSPSDVLSIDGAYFPIYKQSHIRSLWDDELGFSEDFLFNFLAVSQTKGLYVSPDPLMAYRIRPGSISHHMPESSFKVDSAYQYLLNDCPFVDNMDDNSRALFLDRVAAKKLLNHQYTEAWVRDSSLTFEAFVASKLPKKTKVA